MFEIIFTQFSFYRFSRRPKDKTVAFETEEILEESHGMYEKTFCAK